MFSDEYILRLFKGGLLLSFKDLGTILNMSKYSAKARIAKIRDQLYIHSYAKPLKEGLRPPALFAYKDKNQTDSPLSKTYRPQYVRPSKKQKSIDAIPVEQLTTVAVPSLMSCWSKPIKSEE
jgi:hypothetical protein